MAEWHRGGLGEMELFTVSYGDGYTTGRVVKLTALYTKTVNFTVCKPDLTSPDGQYQNQTDYILRSQRWRSSIQSTTTKKTRS